MIHQLKRIAISLSLSALVLAGCSQSTPTSPPTITSPFQTDAKSYPDTMPSSVLPIHIHIQNNSQNSVILDPLVNTQVLDGRFGWVIVATLETKNLVHPLTETLHTQPLRLDPTQVITIDISSHYIGECYTLELHYHDVMEPDRDYVMYSNVFYIESPFIISECPSNPIHVVPPQQSLSSHFELAGADRWVIPYCSAYSTYDAVDFYSETSHHAYATLERLTDWGTWEILHPEPDDCQGTTLEPVEVNDPQIVDVWGAPGFDWRQLTPGWYRWHLRYYELFTSDRERPLVVGEHSWFSDMFYVSK